MMTFRTSSKVLWFGRGGEGGEGRLEDLGPSSDLDYPA